MTNSKFAEGKFKLYVASSKFATANKNLPQQIQIDYGKFKFTRQIQFDRGKFKFATAN